MEDKIDLEDNVPLAAQQMTWDRAIESCKVADFEQPARLDRKDSAIIAKLIFLPNVSRTQDEFRWCCACDFFYWITSHVCLRQITEKKKHFVITRQKWIV